VEGDCGINLLGLRPIEIGRLNSGMKHEIKKLRQPRLSTSIQFLKKPHKTA